MILQMILESAHVVDGLPMGCTAQIQLSSQLMVLFLTNNQIDDVARYALPATAFCHIDFSRTHTDVPCWRRRIFLVWSALQPNWKPLLVPKQAALLSQNCAFGHGCLPKAPSIWGPLPQIEFLKNCTLVSCAACLLPSPL